MTGHAPFIIAAYVVAFVGLGGLVLASLAAWRRTRREISARGLDMRDKGRSR